MQWDLMGYPIIRYNLWQEVGAMKIAICDDSREDRDALRALLEACGHDFEIREYGSGAELYADMGYVRGWASCGYTRASSST